MAQSLSGLKLERGLRRLGLCLILAVLAGCASTPPTPSTPNPDNFARLQQPALAVDAVMFALGLVDTGYRFGGSNPEAGLDCSGMIAYVMERVAGLRLPHNAAQIAARSRPVEREALRPGDLVFFNTRQRRYSHVGLYIGDGRFVHAPSSRGKVRVENLSNRYFAQRYDGGRTLID